MAPLIPEVQQLIALAAGVLAVVVVAITLMALLMRQLRWMGFDGLAKKGGDDA